MARYIGAKCRLCRREGEKLFLKGEKCHTSKCAMENRAFPPGQHGQNKRGKPTDYGIQLQAKQKLKAITAILTRDSLEIFTEKLFLKKVTRLRI